MIGPASRLSQAMELAKSEVFDGALLDLNLNDEMTWGVADLLHERGVPFAFSTGYDGSTVLPERFARQKMISKPFTPVELERELKRLVETPQ